MECSEAAWLRGSVGSDLIAQYSYTALLEKGLLQAFMPSSPLHLDCPSPALLLGWGAAAWTHGWVNVSQGLRHWHRTGTKPYDRTAVGSFHGTPGRKSTICLVQTAARPSNEKMAIYRAKRNPLGLFCCCWHTSSGRFSRESLHLPTSPTNLNCSLSGWLQVTDVA